MTPAALQPGLSRPGLSRPGLSRPGLSQPGRWLWLAAVVVGVALLVPFAMTPIPPLLDYPDHMAEMFVIAQAAADPVLSQVYGVQWTVVPNSAVELVMPPLLRWLPLWPLGKVFLAAALLLPVGGAAVFSRAVFGRWGAWPLAGGLMAYNTLFLLGFMNFLIGIGLAFIAAAAWVRQRGRRPVATVVLASGVATALFFVHLFSVAFFALLVGAHEVAALAGPRGRRWPGLAAVVRRLLPDAVVLVAPLALLLGSMLASNDTPPLRLPLKLKLGELFYPFMTYFQSSERVLAVVLLAVMGGLLWRRRARVAPEAAIAMAVLLGVWPFVPHVYKDTGYIDARFPVMMGFLLFAGFTPVALPRRAAAVLGGAIGLLMLVRVAGVAAVWAGHNADLAEMRTVLAPVAPGSAVLAVDVPDDELFPYWRAHRRNWVTAAYARTYYHLPALLVTDRRAMWPRLFTGRGKQPVVVKPAFAGLTAVEGELPSYHELSGDEPSAAAVLAAPYLAGWADKFQYVVVMAAGAARGLASLPPDRLELVRRTEIAALYRVRPRARGATLPGAAEGSAAVPGG